MDHPAVILILLLGGFFLYTGIYYRASPSAEQALVSDANVSFSKTDYGWLFDSPSEKMQRIFYPGCNHAQFGDYGIQSGDGEALISTSDQQALAVDFILKTIHENE